MADMTPIIQAIGSLGFPIIMSIMLFQYMTRQSEMDHEESKQIREAISKLENAITILTEKLHREE